MAATESTGTSVETKTITPDAYSIPKNLAHDLSFFTGFARISATGVTIANKSVEEVFYNAKSLWDKHPDKRFTLDVTSTTPKKCRDALIQLTNPTTEQISLFYDWICVGGAHKKIEDDEYMCQVYWETRQQIQPGKKFRDMIAELNAMV